MIHKAQSDLILPSPLPLASLPSLTQEITGFFIIENHVITTTDDFRSERDIEELWDNLIIRIRTAIEWSLKKETDPDSFLKVKECMLSFIMTLEVRCYLFSISSHVSSPCSRTRIQLVVCMPSFWCCSRITRCFSRNSSVGVSKR